MRPSKPPALIAAGALTGLILLGLVVYGIVSAPAFSGGCDNIAGECTRFRQGATLNLIWLAMAVVAAMCLGGAVRDRPRNVAAYSALVVCGVALAIGFIVVRPDHKLENRYKGWLHASALQSRA